MNREIVYFANNDKDRTFAYDENIPNLPLPNLNDTLERYYESLKPFGDVNELAASRKIINEFQCGIGKQLQGILEERTKVHKNWVEKWWEDYAYLTDRTPILPFAAMAQPTLIEAANVEISNSYRLKALARQLFFSMELWNSIRLEKLKQATNPDGSVTYSNFLYRRCYNNLREPGLIMDKIQCYFRPINEGKTSSKFVVLSKGRIFCFDGMDANEDILSPQQFLLKLQEIDSIVDKGPSTNEYPVAVLTCDDRSRWAQNRQYLKDLSTKNAKLLDIIEQSIFPVCLDDNCPADWSEISLKCLCGDLHNRWADKSSSIVSFKNGKFGFLGEHSCYDGSISISISTFILMSLMEIEEPCWNKVAPETTSNPVEELVFDLDDHIKEQIKETIKFTNLNKLKLTVSTTAFTEYGRQKIKSFDFNPDAFIQMILQLTYYNMHKEFVATYETALTRQFYNGRTETIRSCTLDAVEWVETFLNPNETAENKLKALRKAVSKHVQLMNLARNGNGIDRHLFGLWCAAFENDIPTPKLYDDPLYKRSGGGGNFILSTSTLGNTINNGFVGPMCLDGYGVFYSMTNKVIWLNVAAFKESTKTSAHKFADEFNKTMTVVHNIIDRISKSKL